MPEGVAAFWSYVQADDESDDGRIISLAEKLRTQYRLITSEDLELFVDRTSLTWGTEWSARIDEAIAGTTFFIPIVTPSYFKSQACRKELLKFTREAKRLGLEQLLLPVYWVTVSELEDDAESSGDEAVRMVGRYQWVDLREARLEDESSSMFRRALFGLAEELAKRAVMITATVEDVPASETADEQTDPGILDKLADSEDAMPELAEILLQIGAQLERHAELMNAATEEMQDADRRGAGMRARLTITERLARDLAEPDGRIEELGRTYAELLAKLDPGMHTLLDLAPDMAPAEMADAIDFLGTTRQMAESADVALAGLQELVDGTRGIARFSRSLRRPLQQMQSGLQGLLDGRNIIAEWGRRAEEIEASLGQPGSGEPRDGNVGLLDPSLGAEDGARADDDDGPDGEEGAE